MPSRPGHADVEHRDVRLEPLDLVEGVAAVAGLGDQLEVRALLDRSHDPLAVEGMVVGDEHPDAGLARSHQILATIFGDRRRRPAAGR